MACVEQTKNPREENVQKVDIRVDKQATECQEINFKLSAIMKHKINANAEWK